VNIYDAIIVGGGPSGASTAFFLSRAGWNVAVVEKHEFPRGKVCGEFISATNRPLLEAMQVGGQWERDSGPPVNRVALFAREYAFSAAISTPCESGPWGRAMSRASLDCLLLHAAETAGAHLWQPWRVVRHASEEGLHRCTIQAGGITEEIRGRVLIAAHGSWEVGNLSTQLKPSKLPSDLLGFKMFFHRTRLDEDLMPLIAFPGGYGGMAHTGKGKVGLSCCIRRDVLENRRKFYGAPTAAAAVLRHILTTTTAVADTLSGSIEAERARAAGPIRPGIRDCYRDGIFRVGNVAGEAHPVIAEGITMALQSGALLARSLVAGGDQSATSLDRCGKTYSRSWSSQFSVRIRSANLFAKMAMTEMGTSTMIRSIQRFPSLLTVGSALSGKAKPFSPG
jgi:flavin-dependent dehydrogenase